MAEIVGFIGLGVMGRPMASHLLTKGHRLIVHSRSRGPVDELAAKGAAPASSPAEVARQASVVITMLPDTPDVELVLAGPHGVLAGLRPGATVIDMSSISPVAARQLATRVAAAGGAMLDAPVSGGEIGAINATLSIMVGGDPAHFENALSVLRLLGKNIVLQGGPGAGQHTKMVNQILVAASMVGTCECLIYAQRSGLDPMKVIESVGSGAAGGWTINNLGPRIVRRDFEPGFYVEHFVKDLGIALEEATRMKLDLPGLALAKQLYDQVSKHGLSRKGTQALMLLMEQSRTP